MKYPIDILKSKECKHTVYRNSPAYVLIFINLGIAGFLGIITTPFINGFIKISLMKNVLFFILLSIPLDLYIVRMIVFREREKLFEMKNNLSNSVAKHFRVNLNSEETGVSTIYKVPYTVIKHNNGVPFVVMQLKFGTHKHKPVYSKKFLTDLYNYFGANKICFNKLTTLEDFSTSPVWENLNDKLSKVESNKFRSFMSKNIKYLRDEHNRVRIPTIYFKIVFIKPELKFRINDIIDDIYRLYKKDIHNFRSIEFLDSLRILDLIKRYHYLEMADIGLALSLEDDTDSKVGDTEVIWVKDINNKKVEEKQLKEIEYDNREVIGKKKKHLDKNKIIKL